MFELGSFDCSNLKIKIINYLSMDDLFMVKSAADSDNFVIKYFVYTVYCKILND